MIAKHFTDTEFECKCGCGIVNVAQDFIDKLDEAREFSGYMYKITSGCRCKHHNKKIGGHQKSMHISSQSKECEAVDIFANTDHKKYNIIKGLIRAGFTHIGIAKDFIHADNSKKKAIWLY